MGEGFDKKKVCVLFLCNKQDPDCAPSANPFCGTDCNHTSCLKYAKNKDEFEKDPILFLSNCANTLTSNKCIFIEEEDYGSVFKA